MGYARCSTAQQELQSRLDALEPLCKRIFHKKISTRVKIRPKLQEALKHESSHRLSCIGLPGESMRQCAKR
ncbi:recombinase family protein [Streptomyces sp. ID03-2B]|uniref:recombinase family protein n=1 Tax=Streptomyces TaxID=1883 RepID=UPI0029B6F685|nr:MULTISPECIES: recombinase family protein [unclassified Streptomyces]MDX3506477.1 recombinase family protein [Streptomyces sp. ATCC51928]MDX3589954.1 recombinase family protein [Streptomyces sp. ID03-2B]MDX5522324.1 recombinase family protein [Streptomyces sp. DE06-01C]